MSGSMIMSWLVVVVDDVGMPSGSTPPLLAAGRRRWRLPVWWRSGSGCRCGRGAGTSSGPGGAVEVPEANVVFTVKLPASLAARVREQAARAGSRSPPR